MFRWVDARAFDSLEPSWNGRIKLMDAILWHSRPNFINTLKTLSFFIGGHCALLLRWVLMNSQTFSSVFRSELLHIRSDQSYCTSKSFSYTLPKVKSLKIFKLHYIFQVKLLYFVYEPINKLNPYCFHDFFLLSSNVHEYLSSNVHEYFTRQSNSGDLFRNHKNSFHCGLRSIRYIGAKTWNEIPEILKNSDSRFSIKGNLKKFIQNTM